MWNIPKTGGHKIFTSVPRGGNEINHALFTIESNVLFLASYQPSIYYRYNYNFDDRIQPLEPYTTSFFNWDTDKYLLEGFQRLSFFGNTNELVFSYRRIFVINSPKFTIPAKTTITSPLNFRYHFTDSYGLSNSIIELLGEDYQTALYPNTIEIDLETRQFVLATHKVIKVNTQSKNLDAVVWRNNVFKKTNSRFPKNKTFTEHANHLFLWQTL